MNIERSNIDTGGKRTARSPHLDVSVLLLFFWCLSAPAQNLAIDWYTIDGGGGRSSGGARTVRATIGQPDATVTSMAGGQFTISGGFWPQAAYELMTPEMLLEELIALVDEADLRQEQALLASLKAALESLERGNPNSAAGQLGAFQNKVRAQVSRNDPALAGRLISQVDRILESLRANEGPPGVVRIQSFKRQPNGQMQMKIMREASKSYILEASTNLVDWKPICLLRPDAEGICDYEDTTAAKLQSRFYRVVESR